MSLKKLSLLSLPIVLSLFSVPVYSQQPLRSRAERGDVKAQFSLGVMYYRGEGVRQNYAEASQWFRRAALQGDARGQFALGRMYENGQGVPQDYGQAYAWVKLAGSRATGDDRRVVVAALDRIAAKMSRQRAAEPPHPALGSADQSYSDFVSGVDALVNSPPEPQPGNRDPIGTGGVADLDAWYRNAAAPMERVCADLKRCAGGDDNACASAGADPKDPCRRYFDCGDTVKVYSCRAQRCLDGDQQECAKNQAFARSTEEREKAERMKKAACEKTPGYVYNGLTCSKY